MDQYDAAEEIESMHRESAINAVRNAAATTMLPATGHCHNCGAEVAAGLRFCDADCRQDYDELQRARAREGRHGL